MPGPLMACCWLSCDISRQLSSGEGAGVLRWLLEQLASLLDLSLAAVSSALGNTCLRGIGLLAGCCISDNRLLWSASSGLYCSSGRGKALYLAAAIGPLVDVRERAVSKVAPPELVCNPCGS